MASMRDQIRDKAIDLLKNNSQGMRWTELLRALFKEFPDTPQNSIAGATWNLYLIHPEKVYKPSRGLWKYNGPDSEEDQEVPISKSLKEEDFYQPFADWLKNELGECTAAVGYGGNSLSRKWGTPDVLVHCYIRSHYNKGLRMLCKPSLHGRMPCANPPILSN